MVVRKRNVVVVCALSIVTFGVYTIYWLVRTKEELNALGAQIPTAWLLLVFPTGSLYWLYKYAEGVAQVLDKRDSPVLWFLLLTSFIWSLFPVVVVQEKLNQMAGNEPSIWNKFLPFRPVR